MQPVICPRVKLHCSYTDAHGALAVVERLPHVL